MSQIMATALSTRWCRTPTVEADSAAGFRADLNPRQMVRIDTAENQSLNLQCGDNAENLAIVDTKFVAAGAAN
jgi:hypothetical protein